MSKTEAGAAPTGSAAFTIRLARLPRARRLFARPALWLSAAVMLASCAGEPSRPEGPPRNVENACAILDERPHWGAALDGAAMRWGAPPEVVMAIIWKESSFQPEARTSRTYTLGFIPSGRRSSAYGYAQAIDGTWEWYRNETGRDDAERNRFEDAADFVGWYMNRSRRVNGIPMDDAFNQYLAYHEGHAGWRRGNHNAKAWLQRVARDVTRQAERYERHILACRG
ncbi:transglycosylase SLT domain-containing protein [Rhodovulum sp. DZ06]|uniref:transglycosylase SLT domain-containing protein n=1 Tax=Rhodovulum sp. DZ06 TaxID=3425126 RepID=UPI003D32FD56